MGVFGRVMTPLVAAWVLAACVTTDRHAARYDACDQEAGACYRDCRVLDDPQRREACQARCTTAVNRCFGDVRALAETRMGYWSRPPAVFYGRYGWWDPYVGYAYGWHGRRYSFGGHGFDRWGYDLHGFDRWGYDRYGYDRWGRRHRGGRGGDRGTGVASRSG